MNDIVFCLFLILIFGISCMILIRTFIDRVKNQIPKESIWAIEKKIIENMNKIIFLENKIKTLESRIDSFAHRIVSIERRIIHYNLFKDELNK